jgi:hypothetical protein
MTVLGDLKAAGLSWCGWRQNRQDQGKNSRNREAA